MYPSCRKYSVDAQAKDAIRAENKSIDELIEHGATVADLVNMGVREVTAQVAGETLRPPPGSLPSGKEVPHSSVCEKESSSAALGG